MIPSSEGLALSGTVAETTPEYVAESEKPDRQSRRSFMDIRLPGLAADDVVLNVANQAGPRLKVKFVKL